MATLLALWLVIAGGGGLVAVALTGRTQRRNLPRRVDLIARPTTRAPQFAARSRVALLGALHRLFTYRMRRSWGVSVNPAWLLGFALATAIAGWLFTRFVLGSSGWLAALIAAGGFVALPRIAVIREQHRSDAAFAELLPGAIDMVVRIVRAGLPVGAAIRTVGKEGEPPLAAVFAKIANQTEIGVPLNEALTAASAATGNADFRFFAVAVALQHATGGNLAGTLETLSQIIRRRRSLRLKARAATAEVKISGIVLGAIPLFVMAALLMVAPNYLDALLHDRRGNVIIGLALLFLFLAGLSMRAMMRNSLSG